MQTVVHDLSQCIEGDKYMHGSLFPDAKITQSEWETSKFREMLSADITLHLQSKRKEKLTELASLHEESLEEALEEPTTTSLLEAGTSASTWSSIRSLLELQVKRATIRWSIAVVGYDSSVDELRTMQEHLAAHGRHVVVKRAKAAAARAGSLLLARFDQEFGHDEDGMRQQWALGTNDDISAIAYQAQRSCLQLLSVLAVVRLQDSQEGYFTSPV